jgi:sugar phosphate isomerase/epimerase
MWPGLVGKGSGEGQEPAISLERMLQLTAAATVDGKKFDGIDYFLFLPHTDPQASDDELLRIADQIASYGFSVGSLVAPVWPGTVGDSAMGDDAAREKFLSAVRMACRIAGVFERHGIRKYGVIRIDSAEFGVAKWRENPKTSTSKIAGTFREAAKIAADHGQRLAAEGEICWAGMHSWKDMLNLLEEVGMPQSLGFQADLAHTYLYLLGYNAPECALVHDKTGKHCPADDPNGKLDIVKCSAYWLKDAAARGIHHICWDGCMFPNSTLENPATWNTILDTMLRVRSACGWN